MRPCPCGRPSAFNDCCAPYINGLTTPQTAEALMRSRYSAYATGAIPYILETTHPDTRSKVKIQEISAWLQSITSWDKLEILATQKGSPTDTTGQVEFVAHFHQQAQPHLIHEKSNFKKLNGKWYYLYPNR